MKKWIVLSILLALLSNPNAIFAQQSCPSSGFRCIGNNGQPVQCASPCISVVTQQGGPAGRGGSIDATCACQQPVPAASIPPGGVCQNDQSCSSSAPYCWGEFHSSPTCQTVSRAQSLQDRQPGGTTGSSFDPFAKCGGAASGRIDTALGCIPTDFTGLFDKFFKLGIGIAGGIAFLLILFGGFQILTSAGNPERLAAGRELITSAITGLLMIIFSVFLLQLIGVDILGIPGFTK